MNFIVYNEAGRILRVGSCPDGKEYLQQAEDEFVLIGIADSNTNYINNNKVMTREPLPYKVIGNMLEVPIGTSVTIDNNLYGNTESGEIEFDIPKEDTYEVRLSLFPYTDILLEVSYESITEIKV